MKGMKALEYRIWARCYNKNKGDFMALESISNQSCSKLMKLNKIYLIRYEL